MQLNMYILANNEVIIKENYYFKTYKGMRYIAAIRINKHMTGTLWVSNKDLLMSRNKSV